MFDPKTTYPQTRFSRDMDLLLEGGIEDQRTADKEKYDAYVE